MSFLSMISRLAAERRTRRRRLRTYMQISNLPWEIQKDIGWPDAIERPSLLLGQPLCRHRQR